MPRWLTAILVVGLIALVSFLGLIIQWKYYFDRPLLTNNTPIEITIRPGASLSAVAWQLKQQGLQIDPKEFVKFARMRGDLKRIKAGDYLITPNTTARQLLDKMVAGKVIMRELTIVEGWTFAQMMTAVNNNPYLTHTLQGLDNKTIMAKVGYPGENPEGMFYPDTYLFATGTTDVKILQLAHQAMQNFLTQAWNHRAPNLPYKNSYEVLIIASMIEKESSARNERPVIAGVILSRLQKNMLLQIDPTVMYGVNGGFEARLYSKDLKKNTPYNTYLYKGLPPTPIAMPSASSIMATLHPVMTNALYYVANGAGGHVFSDSLKKHDTAIRQYLLTPQYCPIPRKLLVLFPLDCPELNTCPILLTIQKLNYDS